MNVSSGGNHDLPTSVYGTSVQKYNISFIDLADKRICACLHQPSTLLRSEYKATKCCFPVGIAKQVDYK